MLLLFILAAHLLAFTIFCILKEENLILYERSLYVSCYQSAIATKPLNIIFIYSMKKFEKKHFQRFNLRIKQCISSCDVLIVSSVGVTSREASAIVRQSGRRVETQGGWPSGRAGKVTAWLARSRRRGLQTEGAAGGEYRLSWRTSQREQEFDWSIHRRCCCDLQNKLYSQIYQTCVWCMTFCDIIKLCKSISLKRNQ